MAINWKGLTDSKTMAFPWMVLAVVYLLIAFFVTGVARWEFPYAVLYAIGFLAVAVVLATKKAGFLSGLMAAIIPALAIFVSVGSFNANAGMWVGFLGFGLLLANEYEVIEWKSKTVGAKYLVFAPFIFWLVWVITYFWVRIAGGASLPLATVLNHGGVALLALDGILRLGKVVKEKQQTLKWIGLGMAVIGALWLTIGLGWGLQLVH